MTTNWTIDNAHSVIGFKVRHMMISNVLELLVIFQQQQQQKEMIFQQQISHSGLELIV